jgi:hypothetical protein
MSTSEAAGPRATRIRRRTIDPSSSTCFALGNQPRHPLRVVEGPLFPRNFLADQRLAEKPAIVDAVEILFGGLLIAAIVVLIGVQTYGRHRRLTRREAQGETTLPRSTWIVFGAGAAFLLFALFIFPILVRG